MKFLNILDNQVKINSSGFINEKFSHNNILVEDESCWKVSNQENPWIKFEFSFATKIERFSLRFPSNLNLGYPIKYKLEGKKYNNSKWIEIANVSLTNGNENCEIITNIECPQKFKFYRLNITECSFDIDNNLFECSISNLKFFIVDDLYLINSHGQYKTINKNQLIDLNINTINENTFYQYGFDNLELLNDIVLDDELEILICSNKTNYTNAEIVDNSNLLIEQNMPLNLTDSLISNITINSNKEFKLLLSNDNGENWFTYNNNKWITINPTEENILKNGISNYSLQFIEDWNIFNNKSLKLLYNIENNTEIYEPIVTLNFSGTIRKAIYGVDYLCDFVSNDEILIELLNNDRFKIQYK